MNTSIVLLLFPLVVYMPAAEKEQTDSTKKEGMTLLKTFLDEFVEITPGQGKFPKSFRMGSDNGGKSERPEHGVTFNYDFSMAKYEVPQDLYERVMGKNPSVWGGPRNAVEMMTWQEANRFCRQITLQLREASLLRETEEIRLPSEAEWEYCCRAGSTTVYSFGDDATRAGDQQNKASVLDAFGWHTGNAAGNDPPVGALNPNAWGLHDMHGYLWEYVGDAWHADFTGAPSDGGSWDEKAERTPRVIRGGSWRDSYELLQSSTRWSLPDHVRSDAIGFRCVKAAVPK